MEEYLLETRQLGKCFGSGEREFWVLKDLNVKIPRGKLTILKGRSGSGKTTLMNQLGALDTPSTGDVLLEGRSILGMSDKEKTDLRRKKMGFVFQSVALMPMMTARENVELALRLAGIREDRRTRVEECLGMVGLSKRADHFPQEMSGGEQQRVAIARAVAHKPLLILADEPTAELDTDTGLKVMRIFRELCEKERVTVIMTTHDQGLMELADLAYELSDGQAVRHE